jgi:hypothetical protein
MRARRAPVSARIAGVAATVETTDDEFRRFAELHFGPALTAAAPDARVRAVLRWHEGAPPDRLAAHPELAAMDRVDRDVYRRAQSLAWFRVDDLPDLQLHLTWTDAALRVEADYYHRLSKTPGRDQVSRLVYRRRLPELRRRRFTTLLYYLVYYPIFWLLEREGWHPIHAGGVELPGGIAVFAGPSGVGKSTTVTGLATVPGARLLSDTFLLHRGPEVRAVIEPLLLDRRAREWLGAEQARLHLVRHRYCLGRDGYHLAAEHLTPGGCARLLVFPHRATSHYVRPLDADHARGRLRAGDLLVNDLRRYWAFAAVLELLDPHPLVSKREASLAALVDAVPVYEVGLTADLTRTQIADEIAALLRPAGAPARRASPVDRSR